MTERIPGGNHGTFSCLPLRAPSQSRLSAVPALPMGEPRGGRCPPGAEGKTAKVRRRSRPARGVRTCEPGGAAALGSPFGGAGERTASLRGRLQWQVWKNAVIAPGYPLSHDTLFIFATACALSVTAFSRASSPIGRAKGRALPALIFAMEIRPIPCKKPPAWDWRAGFLSNWLSP